MRRAVWAFCSTSRNVVPRSSWILRMMSKISRTSSGASPSDGSSSSRSLGLAMRARGGEPRAVGEPQNVLEAVDHDQVPVLLHQPGVTRAQSAVVERLRSGLGVLVVAEEHG